MWVAAVSLIIAFVVFYFIVRVFKNIAGIPAAIKRRKKLVCAQEYQHDIMHGVVELAKGELKNFKKSEYYQKLLREGIIVRPLKAYGMPRHIRVTISTAEQNERFLQTISTIR